MAVTLRDILKAADVIKGQVDKTPTVFSPLLSEMTGAEVFLKFENLQFTGSFKERGALFKLLSLSSHQRQRGIAAMSAGNHAQAVARHAQRLGIPATIVMPKFTPNTKVERTRNFGAEVIVEGEGIDDSRRMGEKIASEKGLTFVHPYDDEVVIAGQGTVALEMLETAPDLEVLLVPVGGGGLIAGCAVAAKGLRPDIQIIGVQTVRFPAMAQALRNIAIECGSSTIAEGIAVKVPGALTRPIVRNLVDRILLVEEDDIEKAVLLLLKEEKTVVEGAGAVGLAALMRYPDPFAGKKVGVVLSGGNIDFLILSSIIQRGLARSGRLVRLQVELRDIPGALAEVSRCISQTDANIVEVHHQRAFTHLPLQSAEVEFVLLTRGLTHVQELTERLKNSGYPSHVINGGLPDPRRQGSSTDGAWLPRSPDPSGKAGACQIQ